MNWQNLQGHLEIKKRFENAFLKKKLGSCHLLLGPSGVGKKKLALQIAQHLICEEQSACGKCGPCLRFLKNQSEAILIIQTSETQIKLEQVEHIKKFFQLQSLSKARVVIIDEAHKINVQSSNSLLKLLEEPPENSYFFLVTHEERAVLPTLKSRCQITRLGPLSLKEMENMQEAPLWALAASQGRMDKLQQLLLEEKSKLRKDAIQLLKLFLIGPRYNFFSEAQALISNKESALETIQVWKTLLRDALLKNYGVSNLMNPDQKETIQILSEVGFLKLMELNQHLEKIEQDILSNIDRNLNFENLYLNWHRENIL